MGHNFILLDFLNIAFRAKHTVFQNAGVDMQIGMAMHTVLNSVRSVYEKQKGTHLVVCLEGRSWRKDVFPDYKLNRKLKQLGRTQREIEDDELFFEAINDLCTFLETKTNATVLRCNVAEADDMISTWISAHPDDKHVIISADSDFYQLISDNVNIYNGVTETLITTEGFFDSKGNKILSKDGSEKKIDPKYELFLKCIRGDTSDNIFSAFPGVREKGSKNKVGIKEAYEDMEKKGFSWNNFMMQKWVDENGNENLVKDKYEFNRMLIDLKAQPDDIKLKCYESVTDAINKPDVQAVGVHLLKFCSKYALKKIADYPEAYAKILNARIK